MTDVFSEEQRSYVMSRVGSKNTKPELLIRSFLHRNGFRFRLHGKDLPGRPDLVLPKYKSVVFVHGCFWHRHQNCPKATVPATRRSFWEEKFERNQKRDRRNLFQLRKLGWRSIVVWECQLAKETTRRRIQKRLLAQLSLVSSNSK